MKIKRRDFVKLAGLATIGPSMFDVFELSAAETPQWLPDGVGSIGRIGVLTPDFDPVPESEMWAMVPAGVSIHAARVRYQRGKPMTFADPPTVDEAVELLTHLAPRVILYGFTGSSYTVGAKADEELRLRLEKRSQNIPVILTCRAAIEAFRILNVSRIALIHPPWFSEGANALGKKYFAAEGFQVLRCERITPLRAIEEEVSPTTLFDWVTKNVPPAAEVVFLGGNGLRAVGAIHALEESLGKPVLTANQVLLWKALRLLEVTDKVTKYGVIFSSHPPQKGTEPTKSGN